MCVTNMTFFDINIRLNWTVLVYLLLKVRVGQTCPDMRQVCPCLGRSSKSQIWILACNSFDIC